MEKLASSAIANADDLLGMVGDLSHALYIMLACERCWATGSIMTALGRDECPQCRGEKSAFPNALKHVESVAARCEEFALARGEQP